MLFVTYSDQSLFLLFWGASIAIPSSDGMLVSSLIMSSVIIIVSVSSGIVIFSINSKSMSSKIVPSGFAMSTISFEMFLIACVS